MTPIVERAIGRAVTAAFFLAERSPFVRDHVLRRGADVFVASALRAFRRGGAEAWERFHLPAIRAAGRGRAAYVSRRLALDPDDAGSLMGVHGYEDPLLGIDGHDAEVGRRRAVRVETRCLIGDRLRDAGCPDFCRVLVHAFEEETLRALNPAYTLEPLAGVISAGDAQCTFVHTIGESPWRASS